MIFCLGEGKYTTKGIGYQNNHHIFNKPVSEEEYKKVRAALDVKNFKLPLIKWVGIKDIDTPTTPQKQMGGYLKTQSYKGAWKEMWEGLSQEDRNVFTSIIHFDAKIFKAITGIDVGKKEEMVEIDGKKFSTSTIKEALRQYVG